MRIYIDGSAWHLRSLAWRRDQRLRGRLKQNGWRVRVFSGYEIEADIQRCISRIAEDLDAEEL